MWAQFIGWVLLFSAMSYFMYVIAWVFESRKPGLDLDDVPVWQDQSRAFLPGDVGLAVMMASFIMMDAPYPDWYIANFWWCLIGSVAIGFLVLWLGRKVSYKPSDYTIEAWYSPSKLWHDIVMFVIFVTIACMVIIPKLFTAWSTDNVAWLILGFAGLGLWVLLMVYDATHKIVPNERQHPTYYQPIWRK